MSDCDGQCSEDLKRYDDEMQCGACGTDFRRMTVTDLEKLKDIS